MEQGRVEERRKVEEKRKKEEEQYNKWLSIWNPVQANELPTHRNTYHEMDLKGGTSPLARVADTMCQNVRDYRSSREKSGHQV